MSADPPGDAVAALQALRRDYSVRMPERALELEARFAALEAGWTAADAAELRRLAHNLAGSGSAYGFPELSADAQRLERALDAVLAVPAVPAVPAVLAVPAVPAVPAAPPTTDALATVGEALRTLCASVRATRID